jgi:predicted metal-dependent hydrolase
MLMIDDLFIEITRKKIKNLHLRVTPPHGQIKVSAPQYMTNNFIKTFVLSKLTWIHKQQTKIQNQETVSPYEYKNGENHYFQGKAYPLKVVEQNGKPHGELTQSQLILYIRPEQGREKRKEILNQWYRSQLIEIIPLLIRRHETSMKVSVNEFRIKRMTTRWGTCHIGDKRIWINLELAKKPPICLEYIVVHEMCHLLEMAHNKRFYRLMDRFLPDWKLYRDELNKSEKQQIDNNFKD